MKPYYSKNLIKIYNSDSSDMSILKDGQIDFIVTSPPYWDLKNYKHNRQIGLGQSYKEYLKKLEDILKECSRVLKKGKFFAMIIGTRISDGELKHIPFDISKIFGDLGFTLKKEIIWVKPKGTQGLWQRGTTQFLKKKPYAGQLNVNIQHEFIHIYQKNGNDFVFNPDEKLDEAFIKDVAWSSWILPVSKQKGHPAPFPYEIPNRLIKLFTNENDVVLDPFIGSGTTAIAATNLKRKCVGFEVSDDFCDICKSNLEILS